MKKKVVFDSGEKGCYWTSNHSGDQAYYVYFDASEVKIDYQDRILPKGAVLLVLSDIRTLKGKMVYSRPITIGKAARLKFFSPIAFRA